MTLGAGDVDGAAVATNTILPRIWIKKLLNARFKLSSDRPEKARSCAGIAPAPLLPILYSARPVKCNTAAPGGFVPGPVVVGVNTVMRNPVSPRAVKTMFK